MRRIHAVFRVDESGSWEPQKFDKLGTPTHPQQDDEEE
jgi:hypothetical protein